MMRVLLAVLAATALLPACNTISGMGKDLNRAGQVISGAAEGGRK